MKNDLSREREHLKILAALAKIESEEALLASQDTIRWFSAGRRSERMALTEAENHLDMRRRTRLDAHEAEAQYLMLHRKKEPMRVVRARVKTAEAV